MWQSCYRGEVSLAVIRYLWKDVSQNLLLQLMARGISSRCLIHVLVD
jgi:hypothetical protein